MVQLRLAVRYGNQENLTGLTTAADFLPELMLRGTEKLSRLDLQDELDKYRVRLSATGMTGTAIFTLQTKRPNFPAALDLLRQILREPSLPEDE